MIVYADVGMLNDLVSSVVVFLHPLPCLVFAHSHCSTVSHHRAQQALLRSRRCSHPSLFIVTAREWNYDRILVFHTYTCLPPGIDEDSPLSIAATLRVHDAVEGIDL